MSSSRRILSGAFASWIRLIIAVLLQILTVPVYLDKWNLEVYGVWLGITTLTSLIEIISVGFMTYIGGEYFRYINNNNKKIHFKKIFNTSILISLCIGTIEIVIVLILLATKSFIYVIGAENYSDKLINDALIGILIINVTSILCGSIGGLYVRAFTALGQVTRITWWGLIGIVISTSFPMIAVSIGYGIVGAAIAMSIAVMLFNITFIYSMNVLMPLLNFKYLLNTKIKFVKITINKTFYLTAKILIDILRQQGSRLLLAPIVGSAELAKFATMKSASSLSQQLIGVVATPLLPEFIAYIEKKNQLKVQACFALIWITTLLFICPVLSIIQFYGFEIFSIWTHGKILFDNNLFGLLSCTVIFYCFSQPSLLIITTYNLIKPQLIISIISILILVLCILFLTDIINIKSAAVGMLVGEFLSFGISYLYVKGWLLTKNLSWPKTENIYVISTGVIFFIFFNLLDYKRFIFIIIIYLIINFSILSIYIIKLDSNIKNIFYNKLKKLYD